MQYENALALRLSLETGMRIGDVLSLTKDQLNGQTIIFTAQKTGKKDKKVISVDLAKRLKQISGKEFIFEGRFGDKPRTRGAVWKDVKKASKILRLTENVGCHSARKTYAVELYKNKGIGTVQKELQHDNMDTTMTYAFADLLTSHDVSEGEIETDELSEKIAEKVIKKLEQMFHIDTGNTV